MGLGPSARPQWRRFLSLVITGPPGQLCQGSESRLPKPASEEPSGSAPTSPLRQIVTPRIPGIGAPAPRAFGYKAGRCRGLHLTVMLSGVFSFLWK